MAVMAKPGSKPIILSQKQGKRVLKRISEIKLTDEEKKGIISEAEALMKKPEKDG